MDRIGWGVKQTATNISNTNNVVKLMNETLFWWKVRLREKIFHSISKLFNINIVIQLKLHTHTNPHRQSYIVWIYLWMRACFAWMSNATKHMTRSECLMHTIDNTFIQHPDMDCVMGSISTTRTWKMCAFNLFFRSQTEPFSISSIHTRHIHFAHNIQPPEMGKTLLTLILIRTYDYHHNNWFKLDQFQFNYCSI